VILLEVKGEISDNNLRSIIKQDKKHYGGLTYEDIRELIAQQAERKEVADYFMLELKGETITVYMNDLKRPLPSLFRDGLLYFHNVILPSIHKRTAKEFPYYYEPVVCCWRSTTFLEAKKAIEKTEAQALIIQSAESLRVLAVVTVDEFLEAFQELSSDELPTAELGQLLPKFFKLDFMEVKSYQSYKMAMSLVNKYDLVIYLEGDEIVRVLHKRPPIPPEEFMSKRLAYASSFFKQELRTKVAFCMCDKLLKKYIFDGMHFLDMATGTGSFMFEMMPYACSHLKKKNICGIGGEDSRYEVLTDYFQTKQSELGFGRSHVKLVRGGRESFDKYSLHGPFDLVVWHLVKPSVAVRDVSKILTENGIVAVSLYDKETLKIIYGIICQAFLDASGILPEPAEEMLDLSELAELLCRCEIKLRSKLFDYLPAEFENSESFLEFVYTACPYVARCFASLDQKKEEKVWDRAKKIIEKRFGSGSFTFYFGVNFVIAQKGFQPFMKRVN
jgi:SAM-dependent methyltransferase